MDAGALPTFLWEGNPAGCNYDPDNMMEGLFKGYLPVRVRISHFIFLVDSVYYLMNRLGRMYSRDHQPHSVASHAQHDHAMPFYTT